MRALLVAALVGLILPAMASAAAICNTTGVYDPTGADMNNGLNVVDVEKGNITLAAFQAAIVTAYAGNTGGVWDFDNLTDAPAVNVFLNVASPSVNVKYGTSLSETLVVTGSPTGTQAYNKNAPGGSAKPISGAAAMGNSANGDYTFAFDQGLSMVGITVLSRNNNRAFTVSAVLDDATTLSDTGSFTTGQQTTKDHFFGFQAPAGRTITGLMVDETSGTNTYINIDDLGFVVAPEPATLSVLALGALTLLGRRRRA